MPSHSALSGAPVGAENYSNQSTAPAYAGSGGISGGPISSGQTLPPSPTPPPDGYVSSFSIVVKADAALTARATAQSRALILASTVAVFAASAATPSTVAAQIKITTSFVTASYAAATAPTTIGMNVDAHSVQSSAATTHIAFNDDVQAMGQASAQSTVAIASSVLVSAKGRATATGAFTVAPGLDANATGIAAAQARFATTLATSTSFTSAYALASTFIATATTDVLGNSAYAKAATSAIAMSTRITALSAYQIGAQAPATLITDTSFKTSTAIAVIGDFAIATGSAVRGRGQALSQSTFNATTSIVTAFVPSQALQSQATITTGLDAAVASSNQRLGVADIQTSSIVAARSSYSMSATFAIQSGTYLVGATPDAIYEPSTYDTNTHLSVFAKGVAAKPTGFAMQIGTDVIGVTVMSPPAIIADARYVSLYLDDRVLDLDVAL